MSSSNGLIEVQKAPGKKKDFSYIVRIKEGVDKQAHLVWLRQLLSNNIASSITYEYSDKLRGYACILDETALNLVRACADIEEICEDAVVYASETQSHATWGLNRISQSDRLTDEIPWNTDFVFTYPPNPGQDVDIWILDTGIYVEHDEFGGRARRVWAPQGWDENDISGHGTAVASIAAGVDKGVAKKANILAVKVCKSEKEGLTSDLIEGMFLVSKSSSERPAVCNISINGPTNKLVDEQVYLLDDAGVHVVVSAGNYNSDASGYSPARSTRCVTVGASDIEDNKWSDSNWGSPVNVFAPGVDVPAAGIGSTDAKTYATGTSFAAPFVTGIVASIISQEGNMSPADMRKRVQKLAVQNKLTGIPDGTVNLLANNGNL